MTKYLITNLEKFYILTNKFNFTRKNATQNIYFRFNQTEEIF